MATVIKDGSGAPIIAWDAGVIIQKEAYDQAKNVAKLPFIHSHVALMPDAHWGMGSTVGSVIATKGAIIPAAVGVDIGCGMCALKLDITADQLPDNLGAMRSAIEAAVPHGRTNNGKPGDRGAWGTASDAADNAFTQEPSGPRKHPLYSLHTRLEDILEIHPRLIKMGTVEQRVLNHMGTLGTGNHFIEVCLDEENNVWVMLHSGSRGIGNAIGMYFINMAKEDMRKWFVNLPDINLAYFPEGTYHFDDYIEAVNWAQDYAAASRKVMMDATVKAVQRCLPGLWPANRSAVIGSSTYAINCHHNYVSRENFNGSNVLITRKGAVRARVGDLGIIPGSMGDKSYIVEGLGNKQSFNSCSHGAGRAMSRTQARRQFTLEDHVKATAGVECRKDESVLDETPRAYKDIDAVMAAQTDLVRVKHTLKQVLCVKG